MPPPLFFLVWSRAGAELGSRFLLRAVHKQTDIRAKNTLGFKSRDRNLKCSFLLPRRSSNMPISTSLVRYLSLSLSLCISRPPGEIAHQCGKMLDVNCGCPIDLVFNKGAGSALLAHAGKLGKSLIGMGQALGEIPLTIKIRTGVTNNQPVAHKLMPRLQSEWGIQAVTVRLFNPTLPRFPFPFSSSSSFFHA